MFCTIKEAWGENFNLRANQNIKENIIIKQKNDEIIQHDSSENKTNYCKHCAKVTSEPYPLYEPFNVNNVLFSNQYSHNNHLFNKKIHPVFKQAILIGLLILILINIFDKS